MSVNWTRREFLATAAAGLAAAPAARAFEWNEASQRAPLFKISLAQWSLHKELGAKTLDHLDFAKTAKSFGIEAVEYVNSFFKDKARDAAYLKEMNTRAAGEGVTQGLIMCDGEGNLGDPDDTKRS